MRLGARVGPWSAREREKKSGKSRMNAARLSKR
jgi:hypothetical protein